MHLTQSRATGHGMHCREILFTPRCSPRDREFPRSGQLFCIRRIPLRSYGTSKLPNFRILAYFLHTKPLNVPSGDQPTAQGLHRRMLPIFPYGRRRSKLRGALRQRSFPATSDKGAGDPQTSQIFAYGYIGTVYPYGMQLHGASDLDQRCLKTRNSKDVCTFPPNVFAPTRATPKITTKPHFEGPCNAKPIIQIDLRKSHVNGATKVKLYSYI